MSKVYTLRSDSWSNFIQQIVSDWPVKQSRDLLFCRRKSQSRDLFFKGREIKEICIRELGSGSRWRDPPASWTPGQNKNQSQSVDASWLDKTGVSPVAPVTLLFFLFFFLYKEIIEMWTHFISKWNCYLLSNLVKKKKNRKNWRQFQTAKEDKTAGPSQSGIGIKGHPLPTAHDECREHIKQKDQKVRNVLIHLGQVRLEGLLYHLRHTADHWRCIQTQLFWPVSTTFVHFLAAAPANNVPMFLVWIQFF